MIPFRGVPGQQQQRVLPQRQVSQPQPQPQSPFRQLNYPPLPTASGHPEQSLDPSDFPALGSVGAGGFQHQHHPQAQPQLAQLAQQQQQPLSSYASQAGTLPQAPPQPQPVTAPGSNSINSSSTPNLAPPQLPPPQHQTPNSIPQSLPQSAAAALAGRDFTPDDFPALGGFNSDVGGHPNGQQNGNLLGGGGAGPRAGGVGGSGGIGTQEQASAVAALQHQQNQHRANLLGSMNGSPAMGAAGPPPRGGAYPPEADKSSAFGQKQPPLSNQPWPTSSAPPGSFSLPSPHFSNGNANPNGASSLEQQQASLRSPNLLTSPAGLPGSLPPPSSAQQQRPVGASAAANPTTAAAGGGLVPPSPGGATPASVPGSLPPPPPSNNNGNGVVAAIAPIKTPAQQVLFSPADRYGLLGLLHIIKTADPDLSMLALGSDLTTLGLDLGATDNLYSTFITPWSDSKAALALNIEPEFHLPSCYNVQPPPAGTKIGNFSDETLFFLFYNHPRDALQEMAAHELYKHNWRYHKDLRLWLTKEAGTEATQKTQSYERGSYIFFDPTLWERVRKDFVLVFESLESRRA